MSETTANVLIDTSLLVAHARARHGPSVLERSLAYYGRAAVSVVTVVEYNAGEISAHRVPDFLRKFDQFVVVSIDQPILLRATYIQGFSIRRNRRMTFADLLIAATAIYHRLALLTLNPQDFRHVAGLRLTKVY
jgi:predicted nucleic acid-binding protein